MSPTTNRSQRPWTTIILASTALAIGLIALPARAQDAAAPVTYSLEALEALALQNNPTIAQAAAGQAVAAGHVDQAGRYPNPTIGYEGDEVAFQRPGKSTQHMLLIEQPVLVGGKLRYRQEVAAAAHVEAKVEAEAQRLRVLTAVRQHFYEVLAADAEVALHEELSAITEEGLTVTRQLQNVGAADATDVLAASMASRRARLEATRALDRRAKARRQLAAMVGYPGVADAGIEGDLELVPAAADHEALLAGLLDASPELRFARAELTRTSAGVNAARSEGAPDLSLAGGIGYNTDRLEEGLNRALGWQARFEVRIELPVFDRNQGEVAAAVAFHDFARQSVRRVEMSIRSRLAEAVQAHDHAREAVLAYRDDILPAAGEAVELFAARYEQMAAAYPQVLIARRELVSSRIAYVEALNATWHAQALLDGYLLANGLNAPGTTGDPVMVRPAGVGHEQ